jgi:hypothetical protein
MWYVSSGESSKGELISAHEANPYMDDSSSIFGNGFAALLNTLSLLAGVFFCACIVIFNSGRRGRPLVSALFPAIPLILTAVCIQVNAAVVILFHGFNEVATEKSSGPIAVFSFVIKSQQFLLWRVVEAAVCILVVALVQIVRIARGMDAESSAAYDSGSVGPAVNPAVNWITASLVFLAIISTAYLVWGCSDINNLIALLVDPTKSAEANARVGNMDIAAVSSYISRHLIFLAVASLNVILGLLALGIHAVEDVRPRRYDAPVSALLALVVLGLSGANIAGGLRTINYMRSQLISRGAVPPSWQVGLVPFAEFASAPLSADSMGTQSDRQSDAEEPPPAR